MVAQPPVFKCLSKFLVNFLANFLAGSFT